VDCKYSISQLSCRVLPRQANATGEIGRGLSADPSLNLPQREVDNRLRINQPHSQAPPCKIIRFWCLGKCQCNRKMIKAFGKIFFAFHSPESKGVDRILFLIFLYYSSNSESTVPRVYPTISTVKGHTWHPCYRTGSFRLSHCFSPNCESTGN
jgi:hypothetical protein